MFLNHFGFTEQPFGVTPDPRFLHLGPQHREALASLVYGTEMDRGFLALIAPPGMGKTSLLFHFLENLRSSARTVFLFQTIHEPRELFRYILADLGMPAAGKDIPEMHQMLNWVLEGEMRARRRFILVIDEAQNLSEPVLEAIRLLSNFETPWNKLLHVALCGQPQLGERLARTSMAQLRQRISAFIRLRPFDADETGAYIRHRLWVAGYGGPQLFASDAERLIARNSGGIPRLINNLCFQSLTIACAMHEKQVDSAIVQEVIADLKLEVPACESSDSRSARHSSSSRPWALAPKFRALDAKPKWARITAIALSAAAMLVLGFASGARWKTTATPHLIGAPPSVEAAGLPASPVRAPEVTRSDTPVPSTAIVSESQAPPQASIIGENVAVVVDRGVTLRHLCLLYLGRYSSRIVKGVLNANPNVADPNEIEAGQRILLPLRLREANLRSGARQQPAGAETRP